MTKLEIVEKHLSYSERVVVSRIANLIPKGGRIVISYITDGAEYSRSTATNALKKLAMAGVVETRNLGTKGTYVKVLDLETWTALAREADRG